MKNMTRLFVCSLFLTAAPLGVAWAQQAGDWGAGAVLGYPTGVTGKWWLGRVHAIDAGIGFADDTVLYGDYLWHAWDLFPQPKEGKLALHLGAGPRLQFRRDPEFGLRFIAGVDYMFPRHPLELFVEAGPVFILAPHTHGHFDAGLGLRFYFQGGGGSGKAK